MSDARVILTVDGPATVKLIHRDTPRREPQEAEQEPERQSWFPTVITDDGKWESFP